MSFAFIIVLHFRLLLSSTATVDISAILDQAISYVQSENLCNGTQLCYTNRSKLEKQRTSEFPVLPCCRDCSCEDNCHLYGDCCLGRSNDLLPDNSECVTNSAWYRNSQHRYRFIMMTKCKESPVRKNNVSDITNNDCWTMWNSTLWNSPVGPIYSKEFDHIYLNKECARCNDVDLTNDGYSMEPRFLCSFNSLKPDLMYRLADLSALKFKPTYQRGCDVVFTPPLEFDYNVWQKRCFTSFITCGNPSFSTNIENGRNLNVTMIADLCHSDFYSPVPTSSGFEMYKNIFCYLCDGQLFDNCKAATDSFNYGKLFGRFDMPHSMTYLLSPETTTKQKNDVVYPRACWDRQELNQICKSVYCPIGRHMTDEGRCEWHPFIIQSSVYEFVLSITLHRPLFVPYEITRSIFTKVLHFDQKLLKGWKVDHMYHSVKNIGQNNTEVKYFVASISSSSKEYDKQFPLGELIDKVDNWYRGINRIQGDGAFDLPCSVSLSHVQYDVHLRQFKNNSIVDNWMPIKTKKSTDMSVLLPKMIFCNFLKFCDFDVDQEMNAYIEEANITTKNYIPTDYGNDDSWMYWKNCIGVCLDETPFIMVKLGSCADKSVAMCEMIALVIFVIDILFGIRNQ